MSKHEGLGDLLHPSDENLLMKMNFLVVVLLAHSIEVSQLAERWWFIISGRKQAVRSQ